MRTIKIDAALGWVALALLTTTSPLAAQNFPADGSFEASRPSVQTDPTDRLAANLVVLARNPKDVSALTEAGRSAVAIGDSDAAFSFLARAEELSPNNGRVKSVIGSALLLVERPADALRLFGEARSLGVPESELARDRGLAYDLRGDNRSAQRDYQIALRNGPDDEVTRRLALSLGISGERDNALRLLDPLLRRQDPSGWRARVFVLAMNGDIRGAESLALKVMPAGMGESIKPFLRRLASLSASDRALAVNYGTMPNSATSFASNDVANPTANRSAIGSLIAATGLAPTNGDTKLRSRTRAASKADRRRPGRNDAALAPDQVAAASRDVTPGFSDAAQQPVQVAIVGQSARFSSRVGKRIGPVDQSRLPPEARGDLSALRAAPTQFTSLPAPIARQATPPQTVTAVVQNNQSPSALFEIPALPKAVAAASDAPSVAKVAPLLVETRPVVRSDVALAGPAPAVLPTDAQAPVVQVATAVAVTQPQPVEKAPLAIVPSAVTPTFGPANPDVRAAAPMIQTAAAEPALLTPKSVEALPQPNVAAAEPTKFIGLASILEGLQTESESAAAPLPTTVDVKIARLAAQRKIVDAAAKVKNEKDTAAKAQKLVADREAAAVLAAAKRDPARVWVQIATGANESGLGITWKRIREKAPAALKGQGAYYVPFKATNRVLVGPFRSTAEARKVVTAMDGAGVSGNLFSSEAGQEISKITSK